MKTKLAWTLWALAPFLAWVWLSGPGDAARRAERADAHLEEARWQGYQEDWNAALAAYDAALACDLPEADARAIRLARARAQVQGGDMWGTIDNLEGLLGEAREAGDAGLEEAVRSELATQRYFAAWLMRLEGGTRDEWWPEAELAREHFRLLAEDAGEDRATPYAKNVEAVIRLQQMDLNELMALPLPKNCSCNCQGLCKSKSSCKDGQCKKPGSKKDGRSKINSTGAGATRRQGSGS